MPSFRVGALFLVSLTVTNAFVVRAPLSTGVWDRTHSAAMSAAADDFVPDMQRRTVMNLVLLAGAAVPVAWMGGGFVYFFVPPSGGGGSAGLTAKDALGDDVTVAGWAKAHPFPERALVQGLKGDAHYLIVKADGTLENFALNAVCTHLGCVVPWNRAANKWASPQDPTVMSQQAASQVCPWLYPRLSTISLLYRLSTLLFCCDLWQVHVPMPWLPVQL